MKDGISVEAAAMKPPQQQQLPTASRSFRTGGRQPGESAVEMGKASPAVIAAAATAIGLGVNNTTKSNSSTAAAKPTGAGIFLPPPKSWHSKKPDAVTDGSSSPVAQSAAHVQQQQQQHRHQGTSDIKQGASLGTPQATVAIPADAGDDSDSSSSSAITAAALRAATPTEQAPVQRAAPATVDYDALMATAAGGGAAGAQPPPELMCPITLDLFKDPVRACDGQAYERDAIEVRQDCAFSHTRIMFVLNC